MTESEALRQFIPILGRISPPGERAIITRNVLERIQGRQTSVMGVSHKHAGALAWPRDTTKAQAFEAAMDAAVDAGEFVSFIHKSDRRHFQIEELASWPGCPAIAPDSPLVFWLGGPDAQQAAPQAAPPAPVTDSASNAPVVTPKAKRRTWWDVSSAYIVEIMQAGQYATAKELYRALVAKARPNAPFDKGTGANRGSLFVREIARSLDVKTVQNKWQALRELAKK